MASKSAGPLRSLETAEQPHPGGWGDRKYKPVCRLHKHAAGTHGVQGGHNEVASLCPPCMCSLATLATFL